MINCPAIYLFGYDSPAIRGQSPVADPSHQSLATNDITQRFPNHQSEQEESPQPDAINDGDKTGRSE